jgi:hypothetical protein
MRNEPKPLSREAAARAYNFQAALEALTDGPAVTLNYTKRDTSTSSSTGVVRFFNGREGMDTMSVTVETADKGMRTINLARILSVHKH